MSETSDAMSEMLRNHRSPNRAEDKETRHFQVLDPNVRTVLMDYYMIVELDNKIPEDDTLKAELVRLREHMKKQVYIALGKPLAPERK